jgi:shikimate kinase
MAGCIVLTGPMGSGKSSVGMMLAKKLGWEFVDLDALIVEQAGRSINTIFEQDGEAFFRQLESNALVSLADSERIVLSTGGGAVIDPENRRQMHRIGWVVNLTASVSVLAERLSTANDRPLLKGGISLEQKIGSIVAEREQFYADADIRIDTTAKTLEDVAAEILGFCHCGGTEG